MQGKRNNIYEVRMPLRDGLAFFDLINYDFRITNGLLWRIEAKTLFKIKK